MRDEGGGRGGVWESEDGRRMREEGGEEYGRVRMGGG